MASLTYDALSLYKLYVTNLDSNDSTSAARICVKAQIRCKWIIFEKEGEIEGLHSIVCTTSSTIVLDN